MPVPSSKYVGITTFYPYNEVRLGPGDSGNWKSWSAVKAQPWPAEVDSWDDMYRFERGDLATGYMYYPDGENSGKWAIESTQTLNSAMGKFAVDLAAPVLALLIYFIY